MGIRDMLKVEVLDGLVEGDQVVVSGADALSDHCRVSATVRAPAAGASSTPVGASAATVPPTPSGSETGEPAPSAATAAASIPGPTQAPAPEIPPTAGLVVPPASAHGHRIFVDGTWAGDGAKPIRWSCGPHNVAIGSRSAPRRVVIPCGGAVTLEDKP
jgi:hypothetical protein